MATKEETMLIEKISRAKMKLESMFQSHSNTCSVELDPEGITPCSCGASSFNSDLKKVIKELSFDE